jgi:hypothetical protein
MLIAEDAEKRMKKEWRALQKSEAFQGLLLICSSTHIIVSWDVQRLS